MRRISDLRRHFRNMDFNLSYKHQDLNPVNNDNSSFQHHFYLMNNMHCKVNLYKSNLFIDLGRNQSKLRSRLGLNQDGIVGSLCR